MEDSKKEDCKCDCHGHGHHHHFDMEDHEWTKEELTHKQEKLEKKLAWVKEKLGSME